MCAHAASAPLADNRAQLLRFELASRGALTMQEAGGSGARGGRLVPLEGVPPEPEPEPEPQPAPPPPPPAAPPPEVEPQPRPPPMPCVAAELQRVRLKPAEGVRDVSAPQLTGFAETAEAAREYQDTVLDINIESWYGLVEEYTFPTEFVPMEPADGQLFVDSYLAYEEHLKRGILEERPAGPFVPPPELAERTARLASKLQAAIERVRGGEGHPVFIKASSRSAKDAPTSNRRLGQIYAEQLASAGATDDNTKMRCMLTAGLELLKAHSAEDALALFLRSERIYQVRFNSILIRFNSALIRH